MPEGEARERNIDSPSRLGVALSMVCEVDVGATVPPGVPPPHAPMMQTTFHPVECAGHAPGVSSSILLWVTVCAQSDGGWNKPPRRTENERKNRQASERKSRGMDTSKMAAGEISRGFWWRVSSVAPAAPSATVITWYPPAVRSSSSN